MIVRFELYRDSAFDYRWRLVAANNAIVAVSSEGYETKQGAEKSLNWIMYWADKAPIHDLTD